MNSKQLGLTEYNNIIMSIYDANPVAGLSGAANSSPPEPDESDEPKEVKAESKTKLVPSGLLYKETLRLRNTAVLNVKLAEMIFRYEKKRFKQLLSDYRGLVGVKSKTATDKEKEEKEEKKEEKDEDRSIGDWISKGFKHLKRLLGNAIKRGIKRLVGKRGIKLVRKARRLLRTARVLKKKFIRRLGRPFRQARRFGQKLLKGAKAGVKGFVRKQFFKGVRGVKGALSTARQVKDIVGGAISMAKGPSKVTQQAMKKPNVMTKIGKGLGKVGGMAGKVAGKTIKPIANIGKGLAKVGGKALGKGVGKSLAKKIPGISILAGIGFGIDRALKGDGLGAIGEIASGIAGTLPGAGTAVSLAIDAALIGRDIAKEGMAEGGEVSSPQLVLVGEGGEKEWIVPKSKLAAFLGAPGALGLLNFGAAEVFSAVTSHLQATGTDSQASAAIPELKSGKELPKASAPKSNASPFQKFNFASKLKDMVVGAFKSIFDKIKGLLDIAKNAVGAAKDVASNIFSWAKDAAGNLLNGLGNALTPPAAAGTMPENASFGRVSGQSGSVAYAGKTSASLSMSYSPFASADVKSKGISIISGKGYRKSTGTNHRGYDLSAPQGTPIYAYLPGKVTRVGFDGGGYGNYIEWTDDIYKQKHLFAHMVSQSPYSNGQSFKQGAVLGNVGSTGVSQGPHLHWEIGSQGSEVDPGQWVNTHPITKPQPKPNLNKPIGPEPEPPIPGNLRNIASAGSSQPQYIPVPMPTGGGLTLPPVYGYGSWGHHVFGN
jgi:murein DD-endopeptidase MepM/ murein hydrolase activator NlpD